MSPPIEKLTKVLELESNQGFDDRAVVGGLETFVSRWRTEALGQVGPDVIERVTSALRGYSVLPALDRSKRVESALRAAHYAQRHHGNTASRQRSEEAPGTVAQRSAPRRAAATRPAQPAAVARGTRSVDDPALDTELGQLRGMAAKTIEPLKRLGILTVRDLLLHAPAHYLDYRARPLLRELAADTDVTVVGTVTSAATRPLGRGRSLLSVGISDDTGRATLRFFNQPYLERQFSRGRQVVASGRVQLWSDRFYFDNPDWEPMESGTQRGQHLSPVYPLTAGISQRWLRNRIKRTVNTYADAFGEPLDDETLVAEGLLSRPVAVRYLHEPRTPDDAEAARRRLAVDELLAVQLWTRRRRHLAASETAADLSAGLPDLDLFKRGLPFAMTGAQERAVEAIAEDLTRTVPMSRLVQGDVGCGKTAVAAAAAAVAVAAGYQVAIMAPTEILAQQHYASFQALLAHLGFGAYEDHPRGVWVNRTLDETGFGGASGATAGSTRSIARLVGSMPAAKKEAMRAAVARGDVDVLIGTHAVIQSSVAFSNLALAVVDEQHRFGVMQRADLALRGHHGGHCHQLVMTATPIPRTLALALNADMDHTVIDEMPPGRRPVETRWVSKAERAEAYALIKERAHRGEQSFVVCPLVAPSERLDAPSAEDEYSRLTEVFADLRLGLIHGRMPAATKERTMKAFREGSLDVLVATTVIEVGVDVPNATVLLVEGADRFGLAQLHQLRGRVGRGGTGGLCILVADDAGPTAVSRLNAMVGTSSGMELAEMDLELRGPGEYFGLRQAGVTDSFRFARDASVDVVAQSGRIAAKVASLDPLLVAPAHEALSRTVAEFDAAVART